MLGRVTALCSELSLDVDPEAPWFFPMNTEARLIGGPNPDGEYHLAMIDGRHRYRVGGRAGTVAYLGFQVLAGPGLTPRRRPPTCPTASSCAPAALLLRPGRRGATAAELDGSTWVAIPADASAIVVRQYIADRDAEGPAGFPIGPSTRRRPPAARTLLAEQLTAMAWTIAKLTTLHRTVRPELLGHPNQLVTAEAADLGAARTPPPTTSTCSARSGWPRARPWSSTSSRPTPATGASPSRTSGTSASTPAAGGARSPTPPPARGRREGRVPIVADRRRPARRGRPLARHRRAPPGLRDHPVARQPRAAGRHHPVSPPGRGRTPVAPAPSTRDDLVAGGRPRPPALDDFGEPTWQEGLDRLARRPRAGRRAQRGRA